MHPYHFETTVEVSATADAVFSHLDDHSRLSAHMSRPSLLMVGSRMAIELDASEGRAVGAIIRLRGRVLGIPLSVEEIITGRNPPLRKIWETTGTPNLLVIGQYRMGYEITPKGKASLPMWPMWPPNRPISSLASRHGRIGSSISGR